MMIVHGLWDKVLDRDEIFLQSDGTPKDKLSDLGVGSYVAVDISIILYRVCTTTESARQFDTVPTIPINGALKAV